MPDAPRPECVLPKPKRMTPLGSLVYDLSPSSVKGAELRVEDLFSDDKGRIPLGL